jgi:capsular polysaccharide biosynthesis protein
LLLNTLISIFLGTLLGVSAALVMELMNRRVRSVEDIVEAIEIPVLAVISGPFRNKPSSRLPKLPNPETS